MSEVLDTSMMDAEQAFRGYMADEVTPLAVSVTGLALVLNIANGTITAPVGHSFEQDGMREAQTIILDTGTESGTMVAASISANVITGTMDVDLAAIANTSDTTAWTLTVEYEKAWQGVTYQPHEGVPYFETTWMPGKANELELGAGVSNRYREVGILQVEVNAEAGGGMQEALRAAGVIAGALRNRALSYRQSGNIRLRQPSIDKMGTGNGWETVIVSVPYRRDAIPG